MVIMNFRLAILCSLFALLFSSTQAQHIVQLAPGDSPADNPLKGLVPYARPAPDRFPHSMEFMYLALSDLMVGDQQFNWQPLEKLLDQIASRGNQAVIRVYMEYPGKEKGIPRFLIEQGLTVHRYTNTNTAPLPPAKIVTPDYEDPMLHAALKSFIAAWGKRYDGDPRLAYITAGLLGTWGEWHTYPRDDLWASQTTQRMVLDAYQNAFQKTPVLLRYPAGPNHYAQAENASRPFGYHDDSFAWATLNTGREEDSWFYMPALIAAGKQATEKWKYQPIGGEIRPEVWGKIFDSNDQWPKQAQNFHDCVSETHATWLMDTGMFREQAPPSRMKNALAEVRRMGYDLYVASVHLQPLSEPSRLEIHLKVINQGVAPFYADWPTELAFVKSDGSTAKTLIVPEFSIRGLLPGTHRLKATVTTDGLAGDFTLQLRVVHPLPNGKPLRFANADQDRIDSGWLPLGTIAID